MEIREALEQLEQQGHDVETKPTLSQDGRLSYKVDGVLRTEEQILRWVVDGVRPGN
jgi:hypothetical protein